MRYLPHTPEEVRSMLGVVGVENLDDLFASVPADCRRPCCMTLPEPMSEWELTVHMRELAANTAATPQFRIYIGAGSYAHHIPAVLPYLMSRSEFVTAYTPYQPEISQGTLQAIYEYQTLTARLLGMDVANASLYDGASALAEGLLMAMRVTKRRRVALSSLIHPLYRQVVASYLAPTDCETIVLPRQSDGRTDPKALAGLDDLAAVALQSPNFFGVIEDLASAATASHGKGGLLVAAFTEPLAWGLFTPPGHQGADIACGEGQSLGIAPSFGGPGLGMFAARQEFLRNMPGRLVGKTTDLEGRTGFVLTLSTREQHIRREKATSNICTNQGLCALTASAYMALLGGSGLRRLARLNFDKSEYLKSRLRAAGVEIPFAASTFNEFVAVFPAAFEATWSRLLQEKIVAGLPLRRWYPELAGHYLFCVTETASRADLDHLAAEVSR